jgi:hypothetical protein
MVAIAMPSIWISPASGATEPAPRVGTGGYVAFACGFPLSYMEANEQAELLANAYAALQFGGITDWAKRCVTSTLPGIVVRGPVSESAGLRRVRMGGQTCLIDTSTPLNSSLTVSFGSGVYFPTCLPEGVDPAREQYTVRVDYKSGADWVPIRSFQFGAGVGGDVKGPPVTGLAATGLYSTNPAVGVIVIDYDRPKTTGDTWVSVTVTGGGTSKTINPMSEPVTVSRLTNGVTYTISVIATTDYLASPVRTTTARPFSHPAAVQDLEIVDVDLLGRSVVKQLRFRSGSNRGRVIRGFRAQCTSGSTMRTFTSMSRRISLPGLSSGSHRCVVQARNVGGWGDKRAIEVSVG